MADEDSRRRSAQERNDAYLKTRDQAVEQLSRIEKDGWRFFQGVGEESMTEVTDDMARRERETIAMMERLMELNESDLG